MKETLLFLLLGLGTGAPIAAIAVGRLTVRGLITHPVTALRVIALLSVES